MPDKIWGGGQKWTIQVVTENCANINTVPCINKNISCKVKDYAQTNRQT